MINPMKNKILGSPRTSFVVPRTPRGRADSTGASRERGSHWARPLASWEALLAVAPLEGRASGASEASVLGTTKEVLGFIIDFLDVNWDFLGFPLLV